MNNDFLKELAKRNNNLNSRLIHDELKYDNYDYKNYKKQSLIFIKQYQKSKSFFKTSLETGINQSVAWNWFIQGQLGNPIFRGFYLVIKNSLDSKEHVVNEKLDDEYIISEYVDGWSYKTYINNEKIFIIADELEDLKKKVKAKGLPLD